jgi:hypothetical protein
MHGEGESMIDRLLTVSRAVAAAAGLAAFGLASVPATAQGWRPAAEGAVAVLPEPDSANGVTGASLACDAQRWSLRLRIGLRAPEAEGTGTIEIGSSRFEGAARRSGSVIALEIPRAAIAPLRLGSSLAVTIDGSSGPAAATFSLRGSLRTIDAVEPLCSPRELPGYDLVAVAPDDPSIASARRLRDSDIEAFRVSTQSEPEVASAIVTLESGRGMFFIRLCGSSWYFGRSGCNVTGHVRDTLLDEWRPAYDNEGGSVYLDLQSLTDGWPDVVALPRRGDDPESVWRWDGSAYAPQEGLVAEDR